MTTRREVLTGLGAAGLAAATGRLAAGEEPEAKAPQKVFRLGVISARIEGQPQPANGHTWHFCESFCPEVNWDALKKYLDPGSFDVFQKHFRNPRENFGFLPLSDLVATHYYERDPAL